MLTFTDAVTDKSVSINPSYVVAIFVVPDGEFAGKTMINLTNGALAVNENELDVLGLIKNTLSAANGCGCRGAGR
jgi:hypothetical protein